jgi:2-hydroxychromene-2-carboxylate isomerase
MMRYADAPAKLAYERLEFRRFIDANALTQFKFNPHFPVNSLLIMRGLIAAGREGVFMPYVEAMMSAMWEQGLNLAEPDVAIKVLEAAGLDGAKLIAMAGDSSVKEELVRNTDEAVARGAFGIPTFFVGDEIFFGKERLGQVEAALARA